MTEKLTNSTGARDGRTLSHDALEEIRLRAFERVEAGESITNVARALGFDPAVVGRWINKARKQGIEALHAKPIPGRPPILDDRQVGIVRALILEFDPDFWGFTSMLWTRAMVAELIERTFKVRISEKAVGHMMRHRMGLTPQRPVRRAFECDAQWGRQWSEEEYPRLRARAQKCGATIYFADEASMRSDYHSGTTWAERGDTPVVGATGKRFSVNLISAISPEGELRWMEVEGNMTAEKFIEFLERMIKDRTTPVFLIVDGHPAHRAKAVKRFVKENSERLELHFLPSYSPHLNPDELVWNHLKNHTLGKRGFQVVGELKRMAHEHMKWLGKTKDIILGFFEEPHCRYASSFPREELSLPP